VNFLRLFLVLTLVQGCGFSFKTFTSSSTKIRGRVPTLAGVVSVPSHNSFHAYAATCTGKVKLFALDANDRVVMPELASTQIQSDGSYEFTNLAVLDLPANVNHVLEVETDGTCFSFLQRPLTDLTQPQDITPLSTVVSYSRSASLAKRLTAVSRQSVHGLLEEATPLTDTMDSYNELASNRAATFSSAFSDSPAKLLDAAPFIRNSALPAGALAEGSSSNWRVPTVHWNPGYNGLIVWKLDGVLVGTGNNLNFSPGANAAGSRTLEVFVGANDGSGQVDTLKPYVYVSRDFVVQNSILPSAPAMTTATPLTLSPDITVSVLTGPGMANCESFSYFGLTYDSTVPPVSFPFTCTGPNAQLENLTLPPGDGVKVIRLWTRDALGVISAVPSTLNVTLDQTAPLIGLTFDPAASRLGGGTLALPLSVTDAVGVASISVSVSTDGGAT
jgi:hypothetical protein